MQSNSKITTMNVNINNINVQCILQYKCGSYAMLVNDDKRPPEGDRSFFCNISEHSLDRDFDKVPVS